MKVIYEPKGRAREYAPLAVNLFTGCTHGCKYCYVPRILNKSYSEYIVFQKKDNILKDLEEDCKKYCCSKLYVQLSFVGDPYDAMDTEGITREALKILLRYKIPVSILTKGGSRLLRDLDIFKKFGEHIIVGQSLTFISKEKSLKWEPNAALPEERIDTFKILKENGIRTWASLEPTIDPEESLELIKRTLPYVDYYKMGKVNHIGIENKIDWRWFAIRAIEILNANGKDFYIKKDLREASGVEHLLTPRQKDQDDMKVKPFPCEHCNKNDNKDLLLF